MNKILSLIIACCILAPHFALAGIPVMRQYSSIYVAQKWEPRETSANVHITLHIANSVILKGKECVSGVCYINGICWGKDCSWKSEAFEEWTKRVTLHDLLKDEWFGDRSVKIKWRQ